MGLWIRSFANVVPLGYVPTEEEAEDGADYLVQVNAYDTFPHALDGMLGRDEPGPECPDGMIGGYWYQAAGPGPDPAMPYGWYARFREALSEAVLGVPPETIWEQPSEWEGRPFFDLIQFADNDGVLGSRACARLTVDFLHHSADVMPPDLRGTYVELGQVFTHAAPHGIVVFC